ncbi:MAG: Gx transporter family protein [Eubacteriales bacterium]
MGSRSKTIAQCGVLTAIALTIFMIEAQFPAPLPFPGAKLGLANAITLFTVYTLGVGWGGMILLARIILGGIFAGQLLTMLYSFAGGVVCLLVLCLLRPFTTPRDFWYVSPLSAMGHNFGQILVASFIMGSDVIYYYLPYLMLLGAFSGLLVGIATREVIRRLPD